MASRQALGDSVGFLHEAFQSNGVVKYRHLGADIGIQSLPINADESRFVPTTSGNQSVELQRVFLSRGSPLTQAQQLIRPRERSGS